MAFVFRSQYQSRSPIPPPSADSSESEQEEVRRKPMKKISPRKGLACLEQPKEITDNSIKYSEKDSLEEEIDKKVKEFSISRKNTKVKQKNDQQYIFKSKCPRVVFSQEKTKESFEDRKKKELMLKKIQEYEIEIEKQKQIDKSEKEKAKHELKVAKTQSILKILHNTEIRPAPSIPTRLDLHSGLNTQLPTILAQIDQYHPSDDKGLEKAKKKGVIKIGLSHKKTKLKIQPPLVYDQNALKEHYEQYKIFKSIKKEKPKPKYVYKKKQVSQMTTQEVLRTRAESESSQEYDSDATPGPGYYDYGTSSRKDFRSKKDKFGKIFYNQSKRFIEQQCQQVCSRNSSRQDKKRNNFFMSRIPRQFIFLSKDNVPPPGFYNTRQTMEHTLIDKMLKNSSTGLFENNLPRFLEDYSSQVPGPGYYTVNSPNFKVEAVKQDINEDNLTDLHLKMGLKNKNLKSAESVLIIPESQKKKKDIIHKRVDKVVEEENYAPFMSSSPKFSIAREMEKKNVKIPKQTIKKLKQNCQPFNSSEPKLLAEKSEAKASVGLYDVSNQQEWISRSHNVLFN